MGTILIVTEEFDYISETINVLIDNKSFKIRVRETEDKVFNPWNEKAKEGDMVEEEGKDETEEEDSSEMSEFGSSECFSDEEDEETEEDTIIPESKNEETKEESAQSNSKDVSRTQKREEDENCKDEEIGGETETNGEKNSTSKNQINQMNKSPIKEIKEKEPVLVSEPKEHNLEWGIRMNSEMEEGVESPLNRIGMSEKLAKLLSRQTPIKAKLEIIEEDKKKEGKTKEERIQSSDPDRAKMEPRVTRSQTRKEIRKSSREGKKPRRFVPEAESSMSYSISSRIEEIGESCGLKKRNGDRKCQRKDNKIGKTGEAIGKS
ncbi:hypothetical protein L2E82_04810 [Cichorium intybus]|uniref:Uncharacterized protein n=1 Tax=Cichorium intybus TaxID=13427 RepID=A0ACB9H6V7_CICIN|nr:hypothetical protein L2E82_04810 [Cichorium intybus]